MIKIQALNKEYSKNQVLKNLDLFINQDQIDGLIGENGTRKTTFFECLNHWQSYRGLIDIPSNINVEVI